MILTCDRHKVLIYFTFFFIMNLFQFIVVITNLFQFVVVITSLFGLVPLLVFDSHPSLVSLSLERADLDPVTRGVGRRKEVWK